jgi:hypothetical protein
MKKRVGNERSMCGCSVVSNGAYLGGATVTNPLALLSVNGAQSK